MHDQLKEFLGRTLPIYALLSGACHAYADDLTWDGSIGNWDTDASWLTGGVEPNSSDTVRIDGGQVTVNQLGEIANFIRLGDTGTGQLSIESGADLSSNYAYLAPGNGTTGVATVSGAGSTWTVNQLLRIGSVGNGDLTISNGGLVDALDRAAIGVYSNSNSTVLVTGTGSIFNANSLFVGDYGDAELTIASGGSVQVGSATIADNSHSTSSATVSGAGSTWGLVGSLTVSRSGDGSLTIDSGGSVSSNGGLLARSVLSTASVTVTGSDSNWANSGSLYLGSGAADIMISAGGSVTNESAYLGHHYDNSSGSVTVTGSGSTWTNTESLYVGEDGTGTLTIADNGVVNVTEMTFVSYRKDGSGTIHFDNGTLNTRSLLATNSDLLGSGTINASGIVSDHDLTFNASTGNQLTYQLASLPGQNITINVDASQGSTGELGVGYFDTATLRVEAGQAVYGNNGWLGYEAGSMGTATVTGAGSSWNSANQMIVGFWGSGELTIDNGGAVNSRTGYIGFGTNTSGTATVSGAGSTWTTSNALYVGFDRSHGTLQIDSGAVVNSHSGIIGLYSNSVGSVTVAGEGSVWDMDVQLYVARYGQGTLNVDQGGHVRVDDSMFFQTNGGTAFLNFMLASTGDPLIDVGVDAHLAGTLGVGLAEGFSLTDADQFTLIDIAGTQYGVFDNVAEGGLLGTFGGVDLFLTYVGGDGNDVVAYAVGPSLLLGDADGDGDVDAFDITAVEQHFGNTGDPGGTLLGDADGDGDVDAFDITAVEQNFGNTSPASVSLNAASIPEPSSLMLLSVGGLLLTRRRRST